MRAVVVVAVVPVVAAAVVRLLGWLAARAASRRARPADARSAQRAALLRANAGVPRRLDRDEFSRLSGETQRMRVSLASRARACALIRWRGGR